VGKGNAGRGPNEITVSNRVLDNRPQVGSRIGLRLLREDPSRTDLLSTTRRASDTPTGGGDRCCEEPMRQWAQTRQGLTLPPLCADGQIATGLGGR